MTKYKGQAKELVLELILEPVLGTHSKQYGVPPAMCEVVEEISSR